MGQGSSAEAGCGASTPTAPNAPAFCGIELKKGAYAIHSLNVAYHLPSINSTFEVGVDNLADKQPAKFFQNNVLNANTDVNTYDTIGRYYFARYTVKF